MRDTIVVGLEQAYRSFMNMLAEFVPRLAVMLIIILFGLLVAFLFKQLLKFILHLTNLDRLSSNPAPPRCFAGPTCHQ